jgi:hypothetical protein
MSDRSKKARWPLHGWLGLILLISFWTLNWTLPGVRTQWLFFPLWLGYCLSADTLVFFRKGHSLLTRNLRTYTGLFFISIPVWWLFELLNLRAQNWFYDGREHFTDFQYAVIASVNFSTVIPAVFGTAELVGTFRWLKNIRKRTGFILTQHKLLGLFITGWLTFSYLCGYQYFLL